jgi:hypothetical protein
MRRKGYRDVRRRAGGNSRCRYRLDWMISRRPYPRGPRVSGTTACRPGIWRLGRRSWSRTVPSTGATRDGSRHWDPLWAVHQETCLPLSEAEIAAIKAGNCEALDESEVQLVGFVDSCLAGKDTSALRDALSTALGEPAVVQLAMLIGYHSMLGIVRAALGVKTGST